MNEIRVLIVEDSRELCDILSSFFETTGRLKCCGQAHNGKDALEAIHRLLPDVLLLDVIMPQLDGLSVLESLHENPPAKMPRILVTSAVGLEQVIRKAMHLGACYYMIKPYGLRELQERIELIASPPIAEHDLPADDVHTCIAALIRSYGVPPNIIGYRYIIDAVILLLDDGRLLAKQIYATLAQANSTSVSSVEGAIRKTIERIFSCPNHALCEKFGVSRRPSNALFLTAIAEDIKQQRRTGHAVTAGKEDMRLLKVDI